MEQHMIIDELRKELRHMKGRRDFYMGEVSRLKADYRTLHDTYIRLLHEHSELRVELAGVKRQVTHNIVTPRLAEKEDPGDGPM